MGQNCKPFLIAPVLIKCKSQATFLCLKVEFQEEKNSGKPFCLQRVQFAIPKILLFHSFAVESMFCFVHRDFGIPFLYFTEFKIYEGAFTASVCCDRSLRSLEVKRTQSFLHALKQSLSFSLHRSLFTKLQHTYYICVPGFCNLNGSTVSALLTNFNLLLCARLITACTEMRSLNS